jgi:hypothetical protein
MEQRSQELQLANDPDLADRAGDDLRYPLITAHEAVHTDGVAAIPHLGTPECAAVLDPDQHGKSTRVRIVDAQVEEGGRAVAGCCKACSGDASLDGRDSADHAGGPLPADCPAACERSLGTRRCNAGGCSSDGNRGRCGDDTKSKDPFQESSVSGGISLTLVALLPFVNCGVSGRVGVRRVRLGFL